MGEDKEEQRRKITEVGRGLKESLDTLAKLEDETDNLPDEVIELLEILGLSIPKTLAQYVSYCEILRRNGDNISYPIENPIRTADGNITGYDESTLQSSLEICGVSNKESGSLAAKITAVLKEKWRLGETIVHEKIVDHIVYQTLIANKKTEEASAYKSLQNDDTYTGRGTETLEHSHSHRKADRKRPGRYRSGSGRYSKRSV